MHWRRQWQPTPVFLPGESQDGGAWWAPVYGVAQSRTRLKRLSSSSRRLFWNNFAFTEKLQRWYRKIPWRRNRLLTPVSLGFPGGSDSKESSCNVGDLGLIPGLGRSPGEGKGYPLQCSCLENPRNGGAWWAAVYGVTQSQT